MPVVELLQAHHDRNSFDCGKALLNDFLRNQARQNADRNVGVTHVAVESIGATEILGYYTLVTRTVDRELIPTKHLARGPVGVVLLGRLAVDLKSQKRGLGKLMLLTAIRKTASPGEHTSWAWDKFLQVERRKNDKPRFSKLVAGRLLGLPVDEMAMVLRSACDWFLHAANTLEERVPRIGRPASAAVACRVFADR